MQSDASTRLEPKGDGGDRYGPPVRLPQLEVQIVIEETPRTHAVHIRWLDRVLARSAIVQVVVARHNGSPFHLWAERKAIKSAVPWGRLRRA